MKQKPQFTSIDVAAWNRREAFWYFLKMSPTGYSFTALHHVLPHAAADGYHVKQFLDALQGGMDHMEQYL